MRAAADSVFVLQKISFFFGVVSICKKSVDTPFTALNAAPAGQGGVNFILGDEHSHICDLCHVGGIFTSRKVQIAKSAADFSDMVIVKPHDIAVFPVGFHEISIFCRQFSAKFRVFQLISKPFCIVRKAAGAIVLQHGKHSIFSCIIGQIAIQIP